MPATRLMPTEEGQDLIDLTREICDKELRPRVDDAERAAATTPQLPRDAFRLWDALACSRCPTPRSSAVGPSPTRSTCRWSRRSPLHG